MDRCPECGRSVEGDPEACPACEAALAADSDAEPTAPGVTRRGLLTYSGGSALLTLAGVGAGWYALVYEQRGPEEEVVREYVAALDRAHFYTAQELFHEEAPGEAWGPAEIPDVGRVSLEVERTEVVDRMEEPAVEGVEELALVHVDVRMDDGTRSTLLELAFVVARNEDGEWKMWRDQ